MNRTLEMFLKPIVWAVYLVAVCALAAACIIGFVMLERLFWSWNWVVALAVHAVIVYLVVAICLHDKEWPWSHQ